MRARLGKRGIALSAALPFVALGNASARAGRLAGPTARAAVSFAAGGPSHAAGALARECLERMAWARLQCGVAWNAPGNALVCGRPDGSVSLFDRATGRRVRSWPAHATPVSAVALSPDEKLVASASDRAVVLWDAQTGKKMRELPAGKRPVWRLHFHPDGARLAVLDAGEVRLYATATGKELLRLAFPGKSLAFSPDGRALALGGTDGTVRVWQLPSGKPQHRFKGQVGWVLAVAFSPDGRTLAAGNWMNVRLYELLTGQERLRLPSPQGDVTSLGFSPDGRSLASGGSDTTAVVWDLTGRRNLPRAVKLTDEAFEKHWKELGAADAPRAYRALWALAAAPKQTLPRLRERLRPAEPVVAGRIVRLIAELDDDDFATRQKASEELARLGPVAFPALRKALEGGYRRRSACASRPCWANKGRPPRPNSGGTGEPWKCSNRWTAPPPASG